MAQVIDGLPSPERGEAIAQAFRNKYAELKIQPFDTDGVLSQLITFASGINGHMAVKADAQRFQAAVAAVIAYLFERCDIFEDPSEVFA